MSITASCSNIFLIGPMGAGKSTIGKQLAQALKLSFIDTDQEIEKRTGADIAWIFELEGEQGFRMREQQVIKELCERPGLVLATGGGAVTTPENRTALTTHGTVVYLSASIIEQLHRVRASNKRPLLQQKDPEQLLANLARERNPLYEAMADITVNTDQQSAQAVVKKIIAQLTNSVEHGQ